MIPFVAISTKQAFPVLLFKIPAGKNLMDENLPEIQNKYLALSVISKYILGMGTNPLSHTRSDV